MAQQLDELSNAVLANNLTDPDGSVRSPQCCGKPMDDDGGCSEGCCDDFRCSTCGKTLRVAWPD